MNHLRFDLRDVLRGLWRDAGYTATAILTLALTIGATTAVFSIVNGVLLRPLKYRESHQLVTIREVQVELADRFPVLPVNAHHFEAWRSQSRTFDAIAEYLPLAANLTGAGEPVQIALVRTTGTLLDVLQVQPIAGRGLRASDEPKGAPDVAVIGYALWRDRFGGDPSIVGRSVTLDGTPYTVVGVLPPGFQLPESSRLSGPPQLTTKVDALVPFRSPDDLGWAGDYNQAGLGRLKRGVSVEQARADLDVVQSRVAPRVSDEMHGPATLRVDLLSLSEAVVGGARRGLLLLMGAIAAVLLIATTNLANLALTRATGRVRDAMIRTALGASRGRLVRQVLLEQLMIAGIGGALGMGVAWTALRVFVRTAPIDLPRASEVVIDARVLLFAAGVSIGAGLLTALLPAWRMIGRDVQGSLRAGGLATTGERGSLRTRVVLLALQVALSVTLLVVTTLLGTSFVKLMRADRGFSADHVLAVDVSLPSSRYDRAPVREAVYDRILAVLQMLPGVVSASWTSVLPFKTQDWADLVTVEGDVRPIFERPIANYRFIAPDFFRTLEMPIRRGRAFADSERAPSLPTTPAVISEATAARAWPGQDALGKRFRRGNNDAKPFEVVGIVADGRAAGIDTVQPMMVYVPYWFRSRASAALVIRTTTDPQSLAGDVRRSIQGIEPEIAVGESRPLDQVVDAAFAARRYQVTLFLAFGAAALLITVIGVYAVTAYGVSRRRREMNIRVALGAQASQVLGLVVRQTSAPIAVGAVAGAAGALASGSIVASQLTDISAHDPFVVTAIMTLVGTVGILTCAIAARQGLAINPASALRDD